MTTKDPAASSANEAESPTVSRREFVEKSSMAGMAFTIVKPHVLGAQGGRYVAPSDKLNVACIGVGGMGHSDVRGFAAQADCNIYALCDVDDVTAERSYRAQPLAKKYKDYRELIDREHKNIDVVTVSTPDHHHAAASLLALRAGKHVYCQKPLARTVAEVRAMKAEAAKRPKQATQMGNQGHAAEGIRVLREWIEAGLIGRVESIEFYTNRPIWPQGIRRPSEAHNVPPTLDWELWLGPVPFRPYHPAYAPFNWRGWWDFGTGAMGDMACHIMDCAVWILGLKFPAKVIPETSTLFPETAPKMSRITYEFPVEGTMNAVGKNGIVTLVWRDGGIIPAKPAGITAMDNWPLWDDGFQLWKGEKGTIIAGTYGENPRLLDADLDKQVKASPLPQKYPRTKGVYGEFIEAIKAGTQPGSNIAAHAGPLTEMIVLGNLAVRAGRTIELNPTNGELLTKDIPAEWISTPYRSGYSL
ncbi:MAG: Gfo/Idh/MocA family oxidoreductase [Gemmatimonadetes bacterium]|nr:Gfo/Idh/MocA family oxidoreductase [Gemmatimonadota bacterium]